MKKPLTFLLTPVMLLGTVLPVFAASVSPEQSSNMRSALMALMMIFAVLLLCTVADTALCIASALRRQKQNNGRTVILIALYITTLISAVALWFSMGRYQEILTGPSQTIPSPTQTTAPTEQTTVPTTAPVTEPTTEPITEPTTEPTTAPTEDPRLSFEAVSTENRNPAQYGIKWDIISGNEIVSSFTRAETISFGDPAEYFALPGIATFRGNNYRNSSTYGTAEVNDVKLREVWKRKLGAYNGWSGSGWTGQPLIVQWDEETKRIMNIYEDKKSKDGLVEVIYATLDGNIYFYDLDDGSYTRDPIYMGMNFKGAGAIDPRGYPILYVGAGIYVGNKAPRMYVISLIDGSILYEYGNNDKYALRNWSAFDSSPLVDAETDTLIWPGENGILYTMKLNTQYDKEAGSLSVAPSDIVKTRYTNNNHKNGRYLGYETSVSIVDHWLYTAENGGLFYCVDLNTMELVWAQDTKDDNNSSPVFDWGDDGSGYIYTAPSLHWTADGNKGGFTTIYKLNASTGEIVWEVSYTCKTVTNVSGGVQSTPLLGREGTEIEGMIFYGISRSPSTYKGILVALNTETGEVIWEADTGNYAWSSPTAFYTEDGHAYIFVCDADGDAKLYDGLTGERLATISLGGTTEASPVVFGNKLIIGTRYGNVHCIEIS